VVLQFSFFEESSMAPHSSRFVFRHLKYGLATGALLALAAVAQPTGTPKGTRAPPQSDSEKPPATRPAEQPGGAMDQRKLGPEKGPASARTQTSRPPSAGSPGGLAPTRDGDPSKEQRKDGSNRHARPAPQ
jgi:hypothetical protein